MYKRNSSKMRILIYILYFVYFSLLSSLYVFYISPYWSYMGFIYEFNQVKLIFAIFIILFILSITPLDHDSRSILLNLFLTVYGIPSLVIFSFTNQPAFSAFIIWLSVTIVFVVSKINISPIKIFTFSPDKFMLIMALLSFLLIMFFYVFGGYTNFNLDITKVYEVRENASEDLPLIFSYLASIFSKIVIPFGVLISLVNKKYVVSILFFLSSILLFGFTSHKGMVIYPILAVFIYLSLSKSYNFSIVLLIFIFAILLCFLDANISTTAEDGSFWGWFTSIFARRGLLVPALLDYYHIDFFSSNPVLLWADSRLSLGLVRNPYGIPSPYVIGQNYFGDPTMAANTGYIGSGFAQAGLVGTIIYAVSVGLTIALINAHGRYQGGPFVAALMTSQVLTMLVSTDFITMFLSHGMAISFLLLSIISPPTSANKLQRPILTFTASSRGVIN